MNRYDEVNSHRGRIPSGAPHGEERVAEGVERLSFQRRCELVMEAAQLAAHPEADWVTFFRDVLGKRGAIAELLPDAAEQSRFAETDDFADIQRMLTLLRRTTKERAYASEPTKVITVRLPDCVHEWLRTEAFRRQTSMNQLCISKLIQNIEDDRVPSDADRDSAERPASFSPRS